MHLPVGCIFQQLPHSLRPLDYLRGLERRPISPNQVSAKGKYQTRLKQLGQGPVRGKLRVPHK